MKRRWICIAIALLCVLLGGSALAGELSGGFDDSSISLAQGESARVSGWVETSGAGLTRVTLTIDGYHTGDDGNDRYASREFDGETSISLQDYGEFTLDSSSAPLNEPGSYTVHLWAADEEGSKELAKMKVTVEAPPAEEEPEFEEETWEDDGGEDYEDEYYEDEYPEGEYYEDVPADEPDEEEYVEEEEPAHEPLPVEINGGLSSDFAEVTLGELATVDGWVEVSNGTLSRVTLTVSGYQTGDGNDRYATREFGGESSIELGNYVEFTLDTTREPLNQPGSYTVNLWAAASDGSSTELGSMTVDVIAPPEPEPEPEHEPESEPGSEPEHEPDPDAVILGEGVALSGGFDEDSVELRVGESRRVAGEVSAQGDVLAQVTYQIDGWSGDDENNRYCTQEVSDASSVKLENMAGLVLDANAAPLNEPGEYTLHLVARVAGGEYAELDAMTVSVLPQDIGGSPSHSPEEGGATVLATGDAYVRTAPDKDSPDLGTVGAGTELPYLGESQTDGRGVTWYKVSFGGAEAWISSNVSQRSGGSPKHSPEEAPKRTSTASGGASSGTVYITGDINARLAPDPDGDILCSISSGTTLEYLGETSTDYRGIDWYRASYNGNAVWLSSRYAELHAGQPNASTSTPEPDIGPVEITGSFDLDSLEMRVGERQVLSGSVSAERDVLVQVTYQIDGWYGDDENNRYCTQAVDGLQSVQLAELEGLCLDGTTEPLNQPGEYTLRLVARTSDGTFDQLDSMAVTVLPVCDHTEIREPLHTVRVDKNDDDTHMAVVLYRVHCQCGQVDYTEEVTEAQPHDLSYRGVEAEHTPAGHNVFVRCNACGYARLTGEHQAFLESCNTCLSAQISSEGGAIRNGARGNIVTQIQDKLVQLGFLSGGVDGIFGKNTQAAVEAFQTARGLPVTGQVDGATWQALINGSAAPSSDSTVQAAEAVTAEPTVTTEPTVTDASQPTVDPTVRSQILTRIINGHMALMNFHNYFTNLGFVDQNGDTLKADVERLSENGIMEAYEAYFGDTLTAMNVSSLQYASIAESIMDDLAEVDTYDPSSDLDNIRYFLELWGLGDGVASDWLGALDLDRAGILNDFNPYTTQNLFEKWSKEYEGELFESVDETEKGGEILTEMLYKYLRYSSVDHERVGHIIASLRATQSDKLKGVAEYLSALNDEQSLPVYLVVGYGLKSGVEWLDKKLKTGAEKALSNLIGTLPGGYAFAIGAGIGKQVGTTINNTLFAVDKIQGKASELQWQIDATKEFSSSYVKQYEAFVTDPAKNYQAFCKAEISFSEMVALEYTKYADLLQEVDDALWNRFVNWITQNKDVKTTVDSTKNVAVSLKNLLQPAIEDYYDQVLALEGVAEFEFDSHSQAYGGMGSR